MPPPTRTAQLDPAPSRLCPLLRAPAQGASGDRRALGSWELDWTPSISRDAPGSLGGDLTGTAPSLSAPRPLVGVWPGPLTPRAPPAPSGLDPSTTFSLTSHQPSCPVPSSPHAVPHAAHPPHPPSQEACVHQPIPEAWTFPLGAGVGCAGQACREDDPGQGPKQSPETPPSYRSSVMDMCVRGARLRWAQVWD